MVTGAHILMPTEISPQAMLVLAQWFSPSFPLGSFAYSHGLESAIEAGDVRDAVGLENWLSTVLSQGSGRNDAILLACAYRAETGEELAEIDELCQALVPSKERLLETVQQGRAFAETTASVWGDDLPKMALPVVVGQAAKLRGLPLNATLQFYLHAFVSNLVLAGVRLIPLGQTDGQKIVSRLLELCETIAEDTAASTLSDLGSSTIAVDIASMKHETQYSRIFRS